MPVAADRIDGEPIGDSASPVERGVREVLFSVATLQSTVARLAAEISESKRASSEPLVVVVILKGANVFAADLIRRFEFPIELEFMALSSYADRSRSSGKVDTLLDLQVDVRGRDVLIVEDIVDTGTTLARLVEDFGTREVASVRVSTLLDKHGRRERVVALDHVGLICPDAFVVGYGLDYAGSYRNLPYVGILESSVFTARE